MFVEVMTDDTVFHPYPLIARNRDGHGLISNFQL